MPTRKPYQSNKLTAYFTVDSSVCVTPPSGNMEVSIGEGSNVKASARVTPSSGHTEVLIGEGVIDLTSDGEDSRGTDRRKVGSGIGSATNSSGSGSGGGSGSGSGSWSGSAGASATSLKRKREDDGKKKGKRSLAKDAATWSQVPIPYQPITVTLGDDVIDPVFLQRFRDIYTTLQGTVINKLGIANFWPRVLTDSLFGLFEG